MKVITIILLLSSFTCFSQGRKIQLGVGGGNIIDTKAYRSIYVSGDTAIVLCDWNNQCDTIVLNAIPSVTTFYRVNMDAANGQQVFDVGLKRVFWFLSGVWYCSPVIFSGNAPPVTTPLVVGDEYVDKTNKKIYFATGILSSSDWTLSN